MASELVYAVLGLSVRSIFVGAVILCLAAGFIGGYEYRDSRRAGPLKDVLVLVKHPDESYRLAKDDGEKFEADWCSDSPEGRTLEPGNKMKKLAYEQRTGCKTLRGPGLGFTVYTDPSGKRIQFAIGEIADVR